MSVPLFFGTPSLFQALQGFIEIESVGCLLDLRFGDEAGNIGASEMVVRH
jgi:hypothetical protein